MSISLVSIKQQPFTLIYIYLVPERLQTLTNKAKTITIYNKRFWAVINQIPRQSERDLRGAELGTFPHISHLLSSLFLLFFSSIFSVSLFSPSSLSFPLSVPRPSHTDPSCVCLRSCSARVHGPNVCCYYIGLRCFKR